MAQTVLTAVQRESDRILIESQLYNLNLSLATDQCSSSKPDSQTWINSAQRQLSITTICLIDTVSVIDQVGSVKEEISETDVFIDTHDFDYLLDEIFNLYQLELSEVLIGNESAAVVKEEESYLLNLLTYQTEKKSNRVLVTYNILKQEYQQIIFEVET